MASNRGIHPLTFRDTGRFKTEETTGKLSDPVTSMALLRWQEWIRMPVRFCPWSEHDIIITDKITERKKHMRFVIRRVSFIVL